LVKITILLDHGTGSHGPDDDLYNILRLQGHAIELDIKTGVVVALSLKVIPEAGPFLINALCVIPGLLYVEIVFFGNPESPPLQRGFQIYMK
jgi:hypothetical protein